METKDYALTCGEVIDNLLSLADAYEKASAGKAPSGFAFNPTDAAANMKAAVHFIGSFGQQIPQWIPVSERLPDEDCLVLWFRPDERWSVSAGRFCLPHHVDEGGDLAVPFSEGRYTHWMPLPEPPEAKS